LPLLIELIIGGRYEYTPGEFREIRIRWNGDVPLFKPGYNIAAGKSSGDEIASASVT